MKQVLLLLIILMLLIVGCNNTSTTVEETDEDNAEINIDVNLPIVDEWCAEDTTYDMSSTGGSVSAIIEGIETYKGDTFCKGVQTTNIEGIGEVKTVYYFTEEGQEMWILTTIDGNTVEKHIVDGELVE